MARNISGAGIAVVLGGVILAYSGITGKSVSKSFRALLAGQSPATTPQTNPISGQTGTDSAVGTQNLTSNQIVLGSGGQTYNSIFSSILQGLGKPVTQGNLNALTSVVQTEGKNSYNNPFNVEWHPGDNTAWKGIGNFNSVGVQEYASPQAGVNATVAFLQQNSHWSQFLSALSTGNEQVVNQALSNAYTWAQLKFSSNPQAILSSNLGS